MATKRRVMCERHHYEHNRTRDDRASGRFGEWAAGNQCGAAMGKPGERNQRCNLKLDYEPEVEWCVRCDDANRYTPDGWRRRGVYIEDTDLGGSWCSACGHLKETEAPVAWEPLSQLDAWRFLKKLGTEPARTKRATERQHDDYVCALCRERFKDYGDWRRHTYGVDELLGKEAAPKPACEAAPQRAVEPVFSKGATRGPSRNFVSRTSVFAGVFWGPKREKAIQRPVTPRRRPTAWQADSEGSPSK